LKNRPNIIANCKYQIENLEMNAVFPKICILQFSFFNEIQRSFSKR